MLDLGHSYFEGGGEVTHSFGVGGTISETSPEVSGFISSQADKQIFEITKRKSTKIFTYTD